jgi:dCMP deaminase
MLKYCEEVAQQSPDIKKVGCVITSKSGDILVEACNDFIHGVNQTEERLERPEKYIWIEHAERNAIYKAAAAGISLKDSIIYVNKWPCIDCCRAIVQTGICKIISSAEPDFNHPRWGTHFQSVDTILKETGIEYTINKI